VGNTRGDRGKLVNEVGWCQAGTNKQTRGTEGGLRNEGDSPGRQTKRGTEGGIERGGKGKGRQKKGGKGWYE